ncbi:hypothetical protein B484DRAFT_468328 [Ochromonadaceae sp. CCMP2298]|nr:hypothetical protein B484DRAFT_468328 [Ochromonadaceae sp. CCMP2298]
MNMSDVERLIRENNTTLLDSIMAITGRTGVPLAPAASAADTPQSEVVWLTFYWGGKFGRYVPEDFTFPRCDVPTLWNVWHHGNRLFRIQPYKKLTHNYYDDLKTRKEQVNLTKAKLLMWRLEEIGIEHGFMEATTNITTITLRQSSALLPPLHQRIEELMPYGLGRIWMHLKSADEYYLASIMGYCVENFLTFVRVAGLEDGRGITAAKFGTVLQFEVEIVPFNI